MNGSSRREFDDSDLTKILQSLQAPADIAPAPGFYARVMERVEANAQRSIWSVFLEPVFGTRLAWASAALMAVLAFVLISNPGGVPAQEEMATLQAQPAGSSLSLSEPLVLTEDGERVGAPIQATPALHEMNDAQGRNVVLVDLASYRGN